MGILFVANTRWFGDVHVIELMRENFFIHYFDIDHEYPDENLKTVITPELKVKLLSWNNLYWKSAATSMTLVAGDTSTVTTIFSFSPSS